MNQNREPGYISKRHSTISAPPFTSTRHSVVFVSLLMFLIPVLSLSGCQKKTERRYAVQGQVIAVHQDQGILEIDEDAIPGYMAAMKMSYVAADPSQLRGLEPGDIVKAELVMPGGIAKLEKIALVRKAVPEAAPPEEAPAKN